MSRHTPPVWFVAITAAFTVVILVMAVAETSIWTHYLIDQGEFLCLGGLAFALGAGLGLHRTGKLSASLPLFVPWLLYPVVTQGDQIIDNLSIGGMRLFAHAVLLVLFLAPIAVAAAGAKFLRRPRWVAAILLLEIGIAYRYLGAILVGLLAASLLAYLAWVLATGRAKESDSFRAAGGRAALSLLLSIVPRSGGSSTLQQRLRQATPAAPATPAQVPGLIPAPAPAGTDSAAPKPAQPPKP